MPAGAVPKDGPSAGVAMVTALTSLLSGRPVRNDVAMTGEITLTGQVLPVGGLKEKSLAAQRAGIKRVIAPDRNEGEILEIPEHEREELEFVYVSEVMEALEGGAGRRLEERRACLRDKLDGKSTGNREREGALMASKKKVPRGVEGRRARAGTARPYVQRLIEDEDLRDNLREAYEAGRDAYDRASGAKRPADVLDDKKLQKDLRSASENLRAATEALREPQKKEKHTFGQAPADRVHRGDPRPGAQRGPPQGAARPALRRRGGVRVQLDDLAARSPGRRHGLDRLSPQTRPKGAERELGGERANRIVDAMRTSVAAHGIAGATFERVAAEAGVSRGLLHYYFGTKERLLVEVVRRDSEIRVSRLDAPLAAAGSADDVLDVLVSSLLDLIENEPGFFVLLFELFSAGRRNPDIRHEVAELFRKSRAAGRRGARGQGPRGRHLAALRGGADRVLPLRDCRRICRASPFRPRPRSCCGPRGRARGGTSSSDRELIFM